MCLGKRPVWIMRPAFSSNFPPHCPLCLGNTKGAYILAQAECPLRQLPSQQASGAFNPFPALDHQLAAAKSEGICPRALISLPALPRALIRWRDSDCKQLKHRRRRPPCLGSGGPLSVGRTPLAITAAVTSAESDSLPHSVPQAFEVRSPIPILQRKKQSPRKIIAQGHTNRELSQLSLPLEHLHVATIPLLSLSGPERGAAPLLTNFPTSK